MATSVSAETGDSRVYELTPVLSDRWRFNWRHLAVCAFFGALFMILGHLPRATSRMWLDLNEGRQIAEVGWVPSGDAALPMSEGMPVVFSSWLSHLLAYLTQSWAGVEAVPQLFAALVWIYVLLLACVFYAQSPRWQVVLIATSLVLLLDAPGREACGPHAWGAVCFALLLGILTCFRAPGFTSVAARAGQEFLESDPHVHAALLLVVLFADVGQSASLLPGRVARPRGGCRRSLLSSVGLELEISALCLLIALVRQWLLLTGLATIATLLNPYGTGIYS